MERDGTAIWFYRIWKVDKASRFVLLQDKSVSPFLVADENFSRAERGVALEA